MQIKLTKAAIENPLIEQLERVSGEEMNRCYQCGKCSAGCPVTFAMEIPPSQIMRFLQLGMIDEVMKANSMWVCVGCLQCYARCPQSVSVANVLEGLRQLHLRKGEDRQQMKDVPFPFLKSAPQQAIVCAFRKFMS